MLMLIYYIIFERNRQYPFFERLHSLNDSISATSVLSGQRMADLLFLKEKTPSKPLKIAVKGQKYGIFRIESKIPWPKLYRLWNLFWLHRWDFSLPFRKHSRAASVQQARLAALLVFVTRGAKTPHCGGFACSPTPSRRRIAAAGDRGEKSSSA